MAYRCTLGFHGKCASCDKFVPPAQRDHAHIFLGGGKNPDLICVECWITVAIAAETILRAIAAAGCNRLTINQLKDFLDKKVTIGIQGEFHFDPPSRN